MHVIEAKGVSWKLPDLSCSMVVSVVVRQAFIDRLAEVVRDYRPCSTGVLPFRLARKSIDFAVMHGQSGAKLYSVIPRHTLHRAIVTFEIRGVWLQRHITPVIKESAFYDAA